MRFLKFLLFPFSLIFNFVDFLEKHDEQQRFLDAGIWFFALVCFSTQAQYALYLDEEILRRLVFALPLISIILTFFYHRYHLGGGYILITLIISAFIGHLGTVIYSLVRFGDFSSYNQEIPFIFISSMISLAILYYLFGRLLSSLGKSWRGENDFTMKNIIAKNENNL